MANEMRTFIKIISNKKEVSYKLLSQHPILGMN